MIASVERSEQIPHEALLLTFDFPRSDFCYASVRVPRNIITHFFEQAALSHQKTVRAPGFHRGHIPLEYIKTNFRESILAHLREFLLKYCVTNFLYEKIRDQKLVVAGEPRLISVRLDDPYDDAIYQFEMTVFTDLPTIDWKYIPFKAPRRKNYKDLDRQVESFIEEEKKLEQRYRPSIAVGDWIGFTVTLANQENQLLFPHLKEHFWFKLGDEEVDSDLKELFLGKQCGDQFFTNNKGLYEYFCDQGANDYNFYVEITTTIPHTFFCFEHLKRHFRIKTNKDMHKKLIEVFSYRDDLSQRRATVEEALKLMLSKHKFIVPDHLILRQQKALYDVVKQNPDYHVYRAQKDFTKRIEQLAEKQAREAIFIDKIAYQENLPILDLDIVGYLNLTHRPRTKEFIYFGLPTNKVEGQELPFANEEIKRFCLREKAINHLLHHLTKK